MPLPATCEEFARLLDYSLLEPQLTDHQVVEGLDIARRLDFGCALVRPCDIDLAARHLQGSAVRPASVCGFPHGANNTATKLYEGRDLLRRGAREVELVAGVSKLLSREFQHVQAELLQMSESCHKEGAAFTAVIPTGYLAEELKIIALRCAERAEADFVAGPFPETALLRKYVPEEVGFCDAMTISAADKKAFFQTNAERVFKL